MGIPVGYVRKFDSRLRVEMLRAHIPQTFKSPGVNVNVNPDNRAAFVVDPATQDAPNREAQARSGAHQRIRGSQDSGGGSNKRRGEAPRALTFQLFLAKVLFTLKSAYVAHERHF